jgi:hypothetical protein
MPGPRPPKPGTQRFRQLEAKRARDLEAYLKLQRNIERLPAPSPYRANAGRVEMEFRKQVNTKENFGKIILKHGHRVVELVVKYYF